MWPWQYRRFNPTALSYRGRTPWILPWVVPPLMFLWLALAALRKPPPGPDGLLGLMIVTAVLLVPTMAVCIVAARPMLTFASEALIVRNYLSAHVVDRRDVVRLWMDPNGIEPGTAQIDLVDGRFVYVRALALSGRKYSLVDWGIGAEIERLEAKVAALDARIRNEREAQLTAGRNATASRPEGPT